MFKEKDQEGGNAGHGHASNEVSLQDEPDGKSRGKGSNYNTKHYMLIEINK